MNLSLRDFQRAWCRATAESFTGAPRAEVGPFSRVLGTAATGAGKTIMASALIWWAIRKLDVRTCFLADTDELVAQAAKKIFETTGLVPSLEKGSTYAPPQSRNVVGSIQSMSRPDRLARWPVDHFGLVIADEAHLSMADSWQRVLNHFHGGGAWILGITATPERADGKDLWEFYEHLSAEIGLFELIEKGFLAPITVETVPLRIDVTEARIQETYQDDGNEMASAIEPYWDSIIDEWKARARGRKTLFFHPGIDASKRFVQRLQDAGVRAVHVDGTTKNRAEILEDFEAGEYECLSNAQLLTKGYDCPDIECVCILRPTQSRVAYQQMVGRGTRIASGKTDLLLLDFLWEFQEKMRPIGPADLVTRDEKKAEAIREKLGSTSTLDLGDAETAVKQDRTEILVEKLRRAAENRRGMRCDARELGILLHQPELSDYVPTAPWEKEKPTDAQKDVLKHAGVLISGIRTRGEASALISAIVQRREQGLATVKQVAMMTAKGLDPAAAATSRFDQATSQIDALIGQAT